MNIKDSSWIKGMHENVGVAEKRKGNCPRIAFIQKNNSRGVVRILMNELKISICNTLGTNF